MKKMFGRKKIKDEKIPKNYEKFLIEEKGSIVELPEENIKIISREELLKKIELRDWKKIRIDHAEIIILKSQRIIYKGFDSLVSEHSGTYELIKEGVTDLMDRLTINYFYRLTIYYGATHIKVRPIEKINNRLI